VLVFALDRGGRRKQRQVFAALEKNAFEQHVVEPFRRRQRVGHGLAGFVVEIESDGTERQVEVDDRRVDCEFLGDAPADIVTERRRSDAAAGADKRDHPADRPPLGIGIEPRNDLDQVNRIEGGHQIFRGAATQQIAVQLDVVDTADHHDFGGGVADLGQTVELLQRFAPAETGFDDE
jgi:hypothetical protein